MINPEVKVEVGEPVAVTNEPPGSRVLHSDIRACIEQAILEASMGPKSRKLFRSDVQAWSSQLLQNICEAIKLPKLVDCVNDLSRLHRDADRAVRYRCSKCSAQMLLSDTTCRVCENRELLGHITTLRTVMQLAHAVLRQALKSLEDYKDIADIADGSPAGKACRQLLSAVWKTFYLIESALDVPVPKVSGPNKDAWSGLASFLGLGALGYWAVAQSVGATKTDVGPK